MIHFVLLLYILSCLCLLAGLIQQYQARNSFERRWHRYFLIFLSLLSLSVSIFSVQYFTFVYLNSPQTLADFVLYYVNIGIYAVIIIIAPVLTLRFNGRPIRFANGIWILAAGLAGAAAAVFGGRISFPVLRRFVCSLLYGLTSLSFFASYGMIFGKGELRSEPFLRRFFLFSAAAFAVITLDAAFIRFSLSSQRYIPDGSISLPVYGICAGILIIRNSSRQLRSHSSEISMSDTFIQEFVITARERDIIACLLKGCTNNQISETLFISPRTVDTHFSNIYRKCNVRSRLELVKLISDFS